MGKLDDVLKRVEQGESTADDAAWLREQFATPARMDQTDGSVALSWGVAAQETANEPCSSGETQILVDQWLRNNGVADGYNDSQFAARLAAWALVEACDVLQTVDLPHVWYVGVFGPRMMTAMGATEYAAALMSALLAKPEMWLDSGLKVLDVTPATFKTQLIDLAIPVFGLAHLHGVDLAHAVDEVVAQRMAVEALRDTAPAVADSEIVMRET